MAEEIIAIFDYLMNSGIMKVALAMWVIFTVIVLILSIAVFVHVLKAINKSHNRRRK